MTSEIEFANRIYYNYEHYKEKSLINRRFKHSDIIPLIEHLNKSEVFSLTMAGESAQKRSINLIKFGNGKTKVFLWSQMHGDESTATMALFDIFNFLGAFDGFNDVRRLFAENLSIYFMPMVNPDGAEVFQRRNSLEIDLNRDAAKQQSPESRILKETFDNLKADFGFNLHDQNILYSAGHTFKPATLSFLAPPVDYEQTIDDARSNSMKLISHLYEVLSVFIPGHIAKYKDDFEPRAFGDNFQKAGTSTILIESGGWKDDPEKQFVRKLNYTALLVALKSIAEKNYTHEKIEIYENIPFNEEDLMDMIIRNVTFKNNGIEYKIDIGITRTESNFNGAKEFHHESAIEDIGDLSIYFGYEDYDFNGMEIFPGKTYSKKFSSISEIEKLNPHEMYSQGYTNIIVNSDSSGFYQKGFPFFIINPGQQNPSEIKIGKTPNFILKMNDKVRYVVINGFLIDTEEI